MLPTIKHQEANKYVVCAKLLTGYRKIKAKVDDPDSYIKANSIFDADFVTYMVSWKNNHKLTADGIIGPSTWRAIAKAAPTCSTSKNKTSGYTMALQILLDTNITCDAIYGKRTKQAVATYEDSNGLTSDGIADAKVGSGIKNLIMWKTLRELSGMLEQYRNTADPALPALMLGAAEELRVSTYRYFKALER